MGIVSKALFLPSCRYCYAKCFLASCKEPIASGVYLSSTAGIASFDLKLKTKFKTPQVFLFDMLNVVN